MFRIPVYYKVPLVYALFGGLWIVFSDRALAAMIDDPQLMTTVQTFKGAAYVLVTSLLIHLLIRIDYRAIEEKEREKQAFFLATIRSVHHILHNFLNQMMIFRHMAENGERVGPELVAQYDRSIEEAQREIAELSRLPGFDGEAPDSPPG